MKNKLYQLSSLITLAFGVIFFTTNTALALETDFDKVLACVNKDVSGICASADFNADKMINEVDISLLKATVKYDLNNDGKVDYHNKGNQCGDVSGDGVVSGLDLTFYKRTILGLEPGFNRPDLCDVGGSLGCNEEDLDIFTKYYVDVFTNGGDSKLTNQCVPNTDYIILNDCLTAPSLTSKCKSSDFNSDGLVNDADLKEYLAAITAYDVDGRGTIQYRDSRLPDFRFKDLKNREGSNDYSIGPALLTTFSSGGLISLQTLIYNDGATHGSNIPIKIFVDGGLLGIYEALPVLGGGSSQTNTYLNWTPVAGNYTIKVVIDPNNAIDELNETNNEHIFALTVFGQSTSLTPGEIPENPIATNPLDIAYFTIDTTATTATIYWQSKASAGIGEYRFSENKDELTSISWLQDGVINGPDTGNIFGSKVTTSQLKVNTTYYIEVRKWLNDYLTGKVYGESKIFTFTTKSYIDDFILSVVTLKFERITNESVKIYWRANAGGQGEYRYAKSLSDLQNTDWTSEGVINGPATGNLYGSEVIINNLTPNTKYYVEVRKWLNDYQVGKVYSNLASGIFKTFSETLQNEDESVDNLGNERDRLLARIKKLEYRISNLEDKLIQAERALVDKIDTALIKRLKGRILLQVEEKGEAWYVDEITGQKFYLKDGNTAYQALKAFGLGVTNDDLEKIPVGFEDRFDDTDTDNDGLTDKIEEALGTDSNNPDTDGDGFKDGDEVRGSYNPNGLGRSINDTSLANRLKGKIILQVESRGEAWYIHPENGKRYYMKDGSAAYQIMRFLSLGITNDDIRKINVGSFE